MKNTQNKSANYKDEQTEKMRSEVTNCGRNCTNTKNEAKNQGDMKNTHGTSKQSYR